MKGLEKDAAASGRTPTTLAKIRFGNYLDLTRAHVIQVLDDAKPLCEADRIESSFGHWPRKYGNDHRNFH
jgi:hypothetical protein